MPADSETVGKRTLTGNAGGYSIDRVEQAIAEVREALASLRENSCDPARRQALRSKACRAEHYLRMAWTDQGGHYRAESILAFLDTIQEACELLSDQAIKPSNEEEPSCRDSERLRRCARQVQGLLGNDH